MPSSIQSTQDTMVMEPIEKRDTMDEFTDKLVANLAAQNAGKTDQERMNELLSTPFFMTSLDQAGEDNEVLEALQSLAFDGEPNDVAENFKNQGNVAYSEKRFKDAVEYYTKGIKANGTDLVMNSVLYSNRAAVNLELCNFRQVLNDCGKAIGLNQANIKAYYRSVRALEGLYRYDEALDCIARALFRDPENEPLLSCQTRITKAKVKADENQERKRLAEEAILKKQATMERILGERRYKLTTISLDNDKTNPLNHPLAPTQKMRYDESLDQMVFPVLFLYPEFNQSDLVSEFKEQDTLYEHFQEVFSQTAPWDQEGSYTPESLEVYFENNGQLISVLKSVTASNAPSQSAAHRYVCVTLNDVLSHPSFEIVNGVCTLIILSRGSDFSSTFKQSYRRQ